MAARRWAPTDEQRSVVMDGTIGHTAAADRLGCSFATVRRWRLSNGWEAAPTTPLLPKGELGTAGSVTNEDGSKTVTSPPIRGGLAEVTDGEAYLRERWNLPEDKWGVRPILVNEWEANAGGGVAMTLGQVKGTFYPIQSVMDLIPSVGTITRPKRPKPVFKGGKSLDWQAVIVSDNQIPYVNDRLHVATMNMIAGLQPKEVAHIGDAADYTNISKHADHDDIKAAVDDCTQGVVEMLEDLCDAATWARIRILKGNHDIRPFTELLLRAERMAGIHHGKLRHEADRKKVLDLRSLWRLDDLGIELVEDPRGWQHAEIEILPGENGLVAVHGHLTGSNVAERTLEKVGRSVMMGHTHGPEHVFVWNPTIKREQQAMVVGCQCAVRGDKGFPTFAVRDGWLQGPAVVSVHSDGEFALERARWNGEALYLGQQRWSA